MFDKKFIDEMCSELLASLPLQAKVFEKELHDNLNKLMQSLFDKLDLVSREEFDVQKKVLLRTRKKVEELENLVAQYSKEKESSD